jgi:hypothetical protein
MKSEGIIPPDFNLVKSSNDCPKQLNEMKNTTTIKYFIDLLGY